MIAIHELNLVLMIPLSSRKPRRVAEVVKPVIYQRRVEETKMRNWILVLGSLLVLVGCGGEGGDSGDSGGTAGGDGAAIYSSECASCHGPNGETMTNPSLVVSVPGSSESELTHVVTNGGVRSMPAFRFILSEEEIDAVVQFLLNEFG